MCATNITQTMGDDEEEVTSKRETDPMAERRRRRPSEEAEVRAVLGLCGSKSFLICYAESTPASCLEQIRTRMTVDLPTWCSACGLEQLLLCTLASKSNRFAVVTRLRVLTHRTDELSSKTKQRRVHRETHPIDGRDCVQKQVYE